MKRKKKKSNNRHSGSKETPASHTDDTQQASEQWLRIFLDSISDMAFLKDENFRHIIVNPALCKFYGKTESEVLGKTDFDLMDEQAATVCRKTDEQTLRSKDLHTSEEVVGGRCYETRKFPVELGDGGKGVGAYIRDITERKQTEEAIIRTAQEWRSTFDSANDMIWLLNSEQRILRANKTSELFFNRPCGEFVGIHCWEIVHGTTEPIPECPLLRAKKSLHRESMELRIGDGWFSVTVDPILNAAGQYDGAVHMVRDITEHRLLEDQLHASEARLRAVADSTPFPMAIVDVEDDKIEYWSRSALELFGHTAPTTTEWYQLAYPDPEYRREVIAHWKPFLEKARRSGKPVNTGEYRVSCHDGSVRICELFATFLSDRLIVTFNDITERKLAEEKLQENVGLLRIAGEKAKLGGWSVDLRNNLCTWSDETAAIHERPAGYSPLLEEGISYYAPQWREKITKVFTDCAQNGIPYDEEMEIITANGKRVWVRTIGEAVKDKTGKIVKVQGAFQDITERKKAEELLRLKNHVFDTSIAANSIADVAGVITETNNAFLKIWGYSSKDEAIGHPISYFLNNPDEAVAIVNALNEKGEWQGNYTAKKKDGSPFIAQSIATSIRNANGNVTGYQSSVMDITEHRRAEETLREKETQYRALADTGLALIWTAGTDKLCNYFNQPWLKFTGRTLEQELGNGWTEGVHPEDLDRCVQIYVTAFDKCEAFDMEYRLRHVSGEYRWIRDLGTPNYNASGRFIGYIGHCFDITEQKTAEDVIKKLNENLEQRVKERTADLNKTIDLLEETNRAFVGRELRMVELKQQIAEMEGKITEIK